MSAQLACYAQDVPACGTFRAELEGENGPVEVAVVRAEDGELYAISDVCSHGSVSLSEGEVEGTTVECWLHGSCFELRTGKPTHFPATEPVATFPVEVRGDDLYVDTTTTLNGVSPA